MAEGLNEWELTVLGMIERAARDGAPCPSNLDIEMELGASSSSIPPTIIRCLEHRGLIEVTRFQRAREITVLTGECVGMSTTRNPDRKTERLHIPRGCGGGSRPPNATDRKPYRSRA